MWRPVKDKTLLTVMENLVLVLKQDRSKLMGDKKTIKLTDMNAK